MDSVVRPVARAVKAGFVVRPVAKALLLPLKALHHLRPEARKVARLERVVPVVVAPADRKAAASAVPK